jgi:hypothetical protein
MGDEGIEPLGIHRNFFKPSVLQADMRNISQSATGEVRTLTPEGPRSQRGASSQLRHSRIDSAGPIRTDKRESLRLAAFPISVTAPQVAGE